MGSTNFARLYTLMISFKEWILALFEVADPVTPSGIRKSNILRDKGTMKERPALQFRWRTKLGNVVKLQFEKTEDAYGVQFYVNDTMDDNASQTDASIRDPEILGGVFQTMKTKADQLGTNKLLFKGFSGQGDQKKVFNIDITQPKEQLLAVLRQFYSALKAHVVKEIPYTAAQIQTWNTFGFKKRPATRPDLDRDAYIRTCGEIARYLQANQSVQISGPVDALISHADSGYLNALANGPQLVQQLYAAIQAYNRAWYSNTEQGYNQVRNRRTAIYTKLVQRYFAQDWDISIDDNFFALTRKNLQN